MGRDLVALARALAVASGRRVPDAAIVHRALRQDLPLDAAADDDHVTTLAVPSGPDPVAALWAQHRGAVAADTDRRRRGAWYTPAPLVEALLELAWPSPAPTAAPPTVLDPSCGDGAFLVVALRRHLAAGWSPDLALGALTGVEADPRSVLAARLALWLAAGEVDLAAVAHAVVHGDALGAGPSALGAPAWVPTGAVAGGADLVVGNPPFVNPMRAGAPSAEQRRRLHERFDGAVDGRTNPAAAFLALAVDLARPDGGGIAMVQPASTLSARHAAGVRARVTQRADLDHLWIDDGGTFDADVATVAVLARRPAGVGAPPALWRGLPPRPAGDPGRPDPTGTWGPLAAPALGVPTVALGRTSACVGDHAEVGADFRDEYYALGPHVRELGPCSLDDVSSSLVPVVTVGTIDPLACWWGRRPQRLHGRSLAGAVVERDELDDGAVLERWAQRRLGPKVVLATQGRVLEPVVDHAGRWLPGVPAITVAADPDVLWHLAVALLSPATTAVAAARHLGAGLTSSALKLAAGDVRRLPLPRPGAAWDEAAVAARAVQEAASAGDVEQWRSGAIAAAGAVLGAQGVGPTVRAELLEWWIERLPSPPRLSA